MDSVPGSQYPRDIESSGEFEALGSIYDTDGKQTTGHKTIWQHKEDTKNVLERLRTDAARGLGLADATSRLAKYGPNVLSPPLQKPWWKKVLRHFTDFFSLMLQFAALLCIIAYATEPSEPMHLYLGLFLFAVVIATSLFSYVQQFKSDKTLREFRNFLPPTAVVRRDGGKTYEIDASKLVVGDIVQVKMGDKIPADLRVLFSNKFTVDNSSLTGESEPIELHSQMTSENPLETANLAFFGCLAIDGSCTGVVIATGDRTVFGDIARLTGSSETEAGRTTLQHDIHHFVIAISVFAVGIGILFFAVGMIKGASFIHNLVYSIGIIVSNIPEGLLATVTVSLTASARRMSRKNVLVKQLDAVETLGSTTVICSDKTGTLTQNRMNVSHIAYGGRVEAIDSSWDKNEVMKEQNPGHDCFQALLYGASVCSTAVFDAADIDRHPEKSVLDRAVCGDASEAGILRFTERMHSVSDFRKDNGLVTSIPFNSKNKYMVTVHRCPDSEHLLQIVMKGAPERIMDRCTQILSKEGVRELTMRDESLLEQQMMYLAGRGERVIGLAERKLSPQEAARVLNRDGSNPSLDDIPTTDYCFVGFISLIDPPRENVDKAVQTCKDAGIRVIMVTGDHPATARSIAQKVGIITRAIVGEDESSHDVTSTRNAIVVNGAEIQDMDPEQWRKILAHEEIVFARTSPDQKLQIVKHLQSLKHVVTVTGDGCNDAPALKQANTGVAMGISGSEVSREAADIVLLDDNFSSIVNGVKEGRLIFDNLKKSIAYTLTSNVPQLIPFLAFIALQIPLPLTTVLVLCIDLGTDIFPAIALAYEKPESDIMRRPPRNAKKDHLMNRRLASYSTLQLGVMQTFSGFFAYLVIMSDYGLAPKALLNLNAGAYFAAENPVNQRWLYSIQSRPTGIGYEAVWFSKNNPMFAKYFEADHPGFIQQTAERFDLLPAPTSKPIPASGGKTGDPAQFQNMVKMIGFETRRPPCLAFSCRLTKSKGSESKNDVACFDPKLNNGQVKLSSLQSGSKNDKIIEGRGPGQGCFEFWTPAREGEALRRAQTGFFVAVVVAQIFTLFACKTRILSVFRTGLQNSAVHFSLVLELLVSLVLVYLPILQSGFDVRPLKFVHWLPGVPFGMFILFYDEARKWFIRRHIKNESGLVVPKGDRLDHISAWVHDLTLW